VIKKFLRNDSITITQQVDTDLHEAGFNQTFSPVRVRSRHSFSGQVYGMDNSASWEIWVDINDVNNLSDFLDLAKVDNMVTFTDNMNDLIDVRISSVDYLKVKHSKIHHIKLVCI